MHSTFTLPFADFWAWLLAHPNCILRAGTPETVLYDQEDFHWHFAVEGDQTMVVQVLRGKNLVSELLVDAEQVNYVQVVPPEREDEHLFELVETGEGEPFAAYFFVLCHGWDEEQSHPPGRVH